jgi:hypothetical protein
MKHGPFISMLAETLGLDVSSVRQVARVIREAGHLTTGPRGVNAPDMTFEDAARMVIALITGEPPSRVVDAFDDLKEQVAFPCLDNAPLLERERLNGRKVVTLEEHLTWVLTQLWRPEPSDLLAPSEQSREPQPYASLKVGNNRNDVHMRIGGKTIQFIRAEAAEKWRAANQQRAFPSSNDDSVVFPNRIRGIQVERTILTEELATIAGALANTSRDHREAPECL